MNFAICLFLAIVVTLGGCRENNEPYKPATFSDELLRKAEEGDPKAQLQLAGAYQEARGVEKNLRKALEWTQKSANQGYPLAITALGAKYFEGIGINKDVDKAFELFQESAEKGCAGGQYNLAHIYYYGVGVPKDNEKAFHWIKMSAEQKNTEAIRLMKPKPGYILGQFYEKGEGCEKNLKNALKWYEIASAQGDVQSSNLIKILQNNNEPISKKILKKLRLKTEIDGLTFYQMGIIGLASYHFDLKNKSYINYENRPKEWQFDDGSSLPDRIYFQDEKYKEKTKEYSSYIVLPKEFRGVKLVKYKFKFDNSLSKIESGSLETFDSLGCPIVVKTLFCNFGSDPTKELVFKRYEKAATNPQ